MSRLTLVAILAALAFAAPASAHERHDLLTPLEHAAAHEIEWQQRIKERALDWECVGVQHYFRWYAARRVLSHANQHMPGHEGGGWWRRWKSERQRQHHEQLHHVLPDGSLPWGVKPGRPTGVFADAGPPSWWGEDSYAWRADPLATGGCRG